MITTIDGWEYKKGRRVWIMWWSTTDNKWKPLNSPFDQYAKRMQWHDKKLCTEQCRLMNQDNKI